MSSREDPTQKMVFSDTGQYTYIYIFCQPSPNKRLKPTAALPLPREAPRLNRSARPIAFPHTY